MVEQADDFSEILTLLKDNPRGLSVTEIADAAQTNRNTIARYMDKLLMTGRVEMRTFGKAKVFFISKRVPVSAMLNLSSEMVMLTDSDLRVVQANEAALKFLSCSEDELVGHAIYEGHGSSLCCGVLTEQIRAALRGEIVRGELRLVQNGCEKVLDQRLYPLVLQDGKPGVTIILDDITENVQAKNALEQSEAMFRRLVETVRDVIWSVDENSVVQYISPQIETVTGYTPDEIVGRTISDFMPADARKRFAAEVGSADAKDNGFELTEFPIITRDGKKIYCDFTGTAETLEEDKTVFLGYNGALRDVSDKRRAEQGVKRWKSFLDAVIDNIPALITVSDLKTNQYYYVNKAAETFLKHTRSEFLETTLTKVLTETKATGLMDAVSTAASFKQTVAIKETKLTVGGEERYVSIQMIPMIASADREYLLLIAEDITKDVADHRRQENVQKFITILEGVSLIHQIWDPIVSELPEISGFESIAIYQRSIFGNYILYRQNVNNFTPAIPTDSIAHRVILRGEPAIFDAHRMGLFPKDASPIMQGAESLVMMPIVFRGETTACIVLGSQAKKYPDNVLRSTIMSTALHISTVASRCFMQDELMRESDRCRKYIEVASVFLAAVSRDGTIEMINKFGADVLGYHVADLIGHNWFEMLVPKRIRESRTKAFQQMVSCNKSDEISTYRESLIRSDGSEIEILWRTSYIREDCGSISGIVTSGELV